MSGHLGANLRLDLQDPLGRHMARRTHLLHSLRCASDQPRQGRLATGRVQAWEADRNTPRPK